MSKTQPIPETAQAPADAKVMIALRTLYAIKHDGEVLQPGNHAFAIADAQRLIEAGSAVPAE